MEAQKCKQEVKWANAKWTLPRKGKIHSSMSKKTMRESINKLHNLRRKARASLTDYTDIFLPTKKGPLRELKNRPKNNWKSLLCQYVLEGLLLHCNNENADYCVADTRLIGGIEKKNTSPCDSSLDCPPPLDIFSQKKK